MFHQLILSFPKLECFCNCEDCDHKNVNSPYSVLSEINDKQFYNYLMEGNKILSNTYTVRNGMDVFLGSCMMNERYNVCSLFFVECK